MISFLVNIFQPTPYIFLALTQTLSSSTRLDFARDRIAWQAKARNFSGLSPFAVPKSLGIDYFQDDL